ncbi:NACHT domain-containing protein [Anabaena azotica]|uniref:NACHT domain-containing NTPase n=1 Tax=Anabaena azotica FACHB-119 TaxID=947527 RepID=A0ABR8DB13_9NOST|nr:NACHT domain-containing NTPase [Anabaena azotica]MBD2503741.1 NACHT domain-containing NTPase [Anabaena azotica FACHB-119]
MTSQGLRASPEGIRAAKTALTDKTLTQQKLAAALGITRQPVSKFFAGEPVSRSCFVQICQQLGLSWQKVVSLSEQASEVEAKLQPKGSDIDALVEVVRQKRQDKIHDQCGTVQILDVAQTIPLAEIYIPVNVLEEIPSQQWLEISDLMADFSFEFNFSGLGNNQHQTTLPALEAVSRYSKLMLLGKPGSGKTTFLQYLAIECSDDLRSVGDHRKFLANQVPIFIRLREFAEDTQNENELNLLKYIIQEYRYGEIEEASTLTLLTGGKALILLDGLDEVPLAIFEKIIQEIRRFCHTFYQNKFVITCRTAAYKYKLPGFNEVEVADFQAQQIELFVKKWFVVVARQTTAEGKSFCNLFIQHLNLPENQSIGELATTPLLLHLLCLVFRNKRQFPYRSAILYEQALNVLFARWDEMRGIKRDNFSADLNLISKKQLLSYIALNTLTKGDYFFTLPIQELISEYLSRTVNATQLPQDITSVINAIAAQDGLFIERARSIYSFSHLAFHEYLAAKYIVDSYQNDSWQLLISNISEERWHKIFLLTISMLKNPDELLLLMKQKVDQLIATEEKIQSYLIWLYQKTSEVCDSHQLAKVRAFYIICNDVVAHSPNYALEWDFLANLTFNPEITLDQLLLTTLTCAIELEISFEQNLHDTHAFNHAHALNINFDEAIDIVKNDEFKEDLQKLRKKLPSTESNIDNLRCWWLDNGKNWRNQLSNTLIKYRNIGHDWQFNEQESKLIQKYFNANKLIIDCLKYYVNKQIKQKVERELFMPITQIRR